MRFWSLKVTGQGNSRERSSEQVHRTNLGSILYLDCSGKSSEAFDSEGRHKYFALNICPENASV